jgi:2,4-dienoyl-CoA reductase-like NADH-dependent reductase (Old Yellow Enzyme family)
VVAGERRRTYLPLAGEVRAADRVKPRLAVWEITLACDLACRHCGSRAGRARPDELSTEEALDFVDQMAELGVLEVTLIGGEAYLREDWTQIVARIKARGMSPLLTTGGRGMTPERAAAAAAAGLIRAARPARARIRRPSAPRPLMTRAPRQAALPRATDGPRRRVRIC